MTEKKKIVRVTGVTKDFDLGKIVVKVLKGSIWRLRKGNIYLSWDHQDPENRLSSI